VTSSNEAQADINALFIVKQAETIKSNKSLQLPSVDEFSIHNFA